MARVSLWRERCPVEVRALQQLAGSSQLYLLRQPGPGAFLVQQGDRRPAQVRLGDRHSCTCRHHRLSRDLCLHICWVLLKKLQLKPYNPLSYQLGLVPRELSDLLSPRRPRQAVPRVPQAPANGDAVGAVPRRAPQSQDLCPICLLPLRETSQPGVHCRYSCGNTVHTDCMAQVGRHQLDCADLSSLNPDQRTRLLTCPLCRGPFCRVSELLEACRVAARCRLQPRVRTRDLSPVVSHDVTCVFCSCHPVVGNLYRCLQCPQVTLCAQCLSSADYSQLHRQHGYAVKQGKWRTVRPANRVADKSQPNKLRLPELQASKLATPIDLYNELILICRFPLDSSHCGLEFEVWVKWQNLCLYMSCVDLWRASSYTSPSSGKGSGLPMIDLSSLLGPPEVRVVRISLTTRPPESRALPPDRPRPPRAPRQPVSPIRIRPRRTKKKKKVQTEGRHDPGDNRLPMSVSLGRALGAQVQPLMAVLMSPRVRPRTTSLHTESCEDEGSDEDEDDKPTGPQKAPLLSITSLELPDLTPVRNPQCRPVRRVRTRRRSGPAPVCACLQTSPAHQALACAGNGMALSPPNKK